MYIGEIALGLSSFQNFVVATAGRICIAGMRIFEYLEFSGLTSFA